MKYKNLFWGIVLILIGILYLLKRFDLIWFNWRDILSLWPLLLVLWGISLLPMKSVFKLLASFAAIIITVLLIYNNPGRWHSGWFWIGDFDRSDKSEMRQHESMDEDAEYAVLELNAAAGTYIVEGETDELVDFTHVGESGSYFMKTTVEGNRHHVYIGPEKDRHDFDLYDADEVQISLNPELVWELDVDAGAADITLDLSGYMISEVNIEGGAASMEIILGSLSDNITMDIETGVSTVLIKVPEELACEVNTDTFLVSKELPGFNKVSGSTYVSPNFSSAEKNITIHFDSGISSLRVLRY